MITLDNIPDSFKPYQNLNFCSNNIIGGGHIFALQRTLPLLIGTGKLSPRIWIQAVASPNSSEFITIVADSISIYPAVKVTNNGMRVIITLHGKTVLIAEASNLQKAIVSQIDFRPLGLNIFGDSNSLNLGGTYLSHNTFSSVGIAFGLGS